MSKTKGQDYQIFEVKGFRVEKKDERAVIIPAKELVDSKLPHGINLTLMYPQGKGIEFDLLFPSDDPQDILEDLVEGDRVKVRFERLFNLRNRVFISGERIMHIPSYFEEIYVLKDKGQEILYKDRTMSKE